MPKLAMDYSKTFIYKICCKDPTITDVYVGHTTNVVKRRYAHKNSCNTETRKEYNTYVYQFIRDNGGWDNWDMIVLIELNCKDINEALREERRYLEELQATLNKNIPTRTLKEYTEQNKEKIATQQHNKYITHKEEYSIKYKEYYKENKDTKLEYAKTYRDNHKETITEYKKEYYDINREKLNEYKRKWRAKQKQAKLLNADNV